MRALHTAATGMMAQELNVQVISNNIANMRTTGYKRQRAEFQDLLYDHVRRIGTQTSDAGQHPAGRHRSRRRRQDRRHAAPDDARHAGADRRRRSTSRSAAKASSRSRCPTAPMPIPATARSRWTRRAASSPRRATWCSRPSPFRRIPPGSPSTRKARSRSSLPGSTTPTVLGQIDADPLHQQGRPASRSATTCSRTRRPPARRRTASPTPTASATCSRATSNRPTSKSVTEISDLIAAQRAYEMNAKVITAADQMLQSTSNLMR